MMFDLIFAVLGICLVLVIVVPGVYNYVKSMRENVREKDAKNAFFNTLYFVVVLVLCIFVFKYIGVFHAFDTIATYLN
ncbi:hypothetical protein HMPREF2137_10415 [Hoylesella buccalis DNF00853]|uniref:Uncharacterized protein n=2 Tax=Hoylesella buccalis TaxID=28127 RepID=A0A095ZGI8_9BACT|nr:hypothetical protein HMPREF2137_10415 [Hoylesella buccalis DNF00853]